MLSCTSGGAGGFDEVFADPKMADFKDKLTETHKGVLRRGELDEIKKALDDEAVAMGGDPSADIWEKLGTGSRLAALFADRKTNIGLSGARSTAQN